MAYGLPVLAYHKVDFQKELGITIISPQRFEKQIRLLKYKRYISISPQSLIALQNELHNMEENDHITGTKRVLITFDDGYEGVYTYAYPILREYGFTAVIFLTTGYIGRHNSWDASPGPRFRHLDWSHIREMAEDGIWFGSHGVNHTFLTRQDNRSAKYEIEASKHKLEDSLGMPIHFFSYPYGDYDDRIISFVQEAGYKAAFSLRPELLEAKYTDNSAFVITDHSSNYKYKLPRIAIYLIDDMWTFKTKIGSAHGNSLFYIQKLKNRLINKCSHARKRNA